MTEDISVVIDSAESGGPPGASPWLFRMGGQGGHRVVPHGRDVWAVPGLGIEFEVVDQGGQPGLRIRRYGETVFAPREPSASQDDGPTDRVIPMLEDLTRRLMIGHHVPGAGIVLIRNGRVTWSGYFGVKRAGEPARITSETVFEAASMSKPAYTYAFMQLVEEGIIDLDTPLVHYLGRDYVPNDTLHREITARMVLSHTTGFPNWRGDSELAVRFPPGTDIGYSGEGFQFLQTVVEKLTGASTAAFTQDRLLQPLGLSNASYEWRSAYDSTMARGHDSDGAPRERRPYTDANSAYTLYVTPGEYAELLNEIMRAAGSGGHLLNVTTVERMLEPQHVAPDRSPVVRGGEAEGEVHYALGWRLDRIPGGDHYWHSGSNSTGFKCYSEFNPMSGNGIVIMTNSSSGGALWQAVVAAMGTHTSRPRRPDR